MKSNPDQQSLFCDSNEHNGAIFDPSKKYRYRLWRRWDRSREMAMWVMLNPSTADETVLDPTMRRCIDYAKMWGFGGIEVCNVYAYRSTKPSGLWKVDDPMGPDNLKHIDKVARGNVGIIVLGWGSNAKPKDAKLVYDVIVAAGKTTHAIEVTERGGWPRHPLYLPRLFTPEPWSWPE